MKCISPFPEMTPTLSKVSPIIQTVCGLSSAKWYQISTFVNFCPLVTLYQTTNGSDLSKLKARADDKINVTEKLKFDLGRTENIVGKGENAGYQHFLLFPKCFQ